MPMSVACPECENHLKVKDEQVGRKIRCPNCAAVFIAADEEKGPVRKQPRDKEAVANQQRDGGEEPRPRGRARKKGAGGRGLLIGLGIGAGVLVLLLGVGVIVLILYFRQGGKMGSASGIPGLTGVVDNPKVTEENFDRVTREMSREQVEAFLGPGERIPRTEIYKILQQPTPAKVTDKTTVVKWKNGGDTIILEWYTDGTIVWSSYVREQGSGKAPKSRGLGTSRF
jgi:predicted Zn finger-like uncharacterized protein